MDVFQLSSLAMARRAYVSLAPGCPAGATGGCEKQSYMNPVGVPGAERGVAMANTYCQLFVHFVFAVQSRESVIDVSWRDDLHRFVAGAVKTA